MLRRGRQNVATRSYGEAGRALQLADVARPAAGCNSLLRQWPAALQLAALGRQRCNSRRWAGNAATRGDGRQSGAALANAALQRFCFVFYFYFLLDNFKSERERETEREREGEPLKHVYSKISTLLVGRNVTRKLLPVPTQAPSGSSNTPTPSGSSNSSTNNSNSNNNSRTYK
jgi:hypothetical protein